MKRLFVAITILFCSLPFMASLSLRNIYDTHNNHLVGRFWRNQATKFAEDVISQDESVKRPTIFIHTPVNTVKEYQEEGHTKVFYNSSTNETSWNDENY